MFEFFCVPTKQCAHKMVCPLLLAQFLRLQRRRTSNTCPTVQKILSFYANPFNVVVQRRWTRSFYVRTKLLLFLEVNKFGQKQLYNGVEPIFQNFSSENSSTEFVQLRRTLFSWTLKSSNTRCTTFDFVECVKTGLLRSFSKTSRSFLLKAWTADIHLTNFMTE